MAIASVGQDVGRDGGTRRLPVVDIARGVAIVAMVVYHTAFDLAAHRLIATDIASSLGWKIFARSVAGSFLLLVGIGLVLAARGGIDWSAYRRRLIFIAGGAALVSFATWWFDPATFVFFGILHQIAVASLLALPFLLWAPVWLTAVVAALVIAAPWFAAHPLFNAWPLWFVGLSTEPPTTVDYVPLFPWTGVVLAGVVLGHLVAANADALARIRPANAVARWLGIAGRWSLVIYLVHQPLIVGICRWSLWLCCPRGKPPARISSTSASPGAQWEKTANRTASRSATACSKVSTKPNCSRSRRPSR